jgi:chromosome segregation ATPase
VATLQADKLQSLVQKLLLDKADVIMADPETQMSDEALTEEMVKVWGQVKNLLTAEGDQDFRTEIQESWKSFESAQYDAEMAAVQLAKEREEAEERARQLEIERLEALKRLKKAQEQMADAKATQHDAMMKMKEAKNLKHRAQQARDEKKLLEMQLGSLKEEAVKCGKALQELEEKEQDARQAFDEVVLDVQEAAKKLTLCEAKLKTAERSVQRLTQEYEVGHDQLRVQAANCLTFHQVKEVFDKHDADGSGKTFLRQRRSRSISASAFDIVLRVNCLRCDRRAGTGGDQTCTARLGTAQSRQGSRVSSQDFPPPYLIFIHFAARPKLLASQHRK